MLRHRVEQMDELGTRGVGILQLQVAGLVTDLAQAQADTRAWQATHEAHHEVERHERIIARRWLVGTGVGGVASMAAVITMLWQIIGHIH